MNEVRERKYLSPSGSPSLWYAFLGAPIVWFIQLNVGYFAVPYACKFDRTFVLYAIVLSALALTVFAAWLANSIWRREGGWDPGEYASPPERSRFLAVMGLMFSGLVALILLGELVAIAVKGPCIQCVVELQRSVSVQHQPGSTRMWPVPTHPA